MKNNYTHLTFLLDRSGSMDSIKNDTIGGVNSFIESQKKQSGELTVSLFQFDNLFETCYKMRPISEVPLLNNTSFVPRGSTALLDAIGRSVNELGLTLSNMNEADRPAKIMFVIVTDGQENASVEFDMNKVKTMIDQQTETYKWEFIFLCNSLETFNEALDLGISRDNALLVDMDDSICYSKSFACLNAQISSRRNSNKITKGFSDKDRENVK